MNGKTKQIVTAALFAALACVATMVIKIPSPMDGYLNLGDCVVLAAGWLLAPGYGFEIVESGISTAADIPLALDALLGKVDCLTNLTDNTVVSALALVLDKANAAGKPVFGSEIEQVKLGCVAAEGLDYVALGRQTGLMAAKVLKGEVKASDMAYEVISDPSLYVNAEALARFGITLSDDLAARAIEAE